MAEPNETSGQPAAGTQSSSTGTQAQSTAAPEGFVPIERLNGALLKIETLTISGRTIAEQSVQKDLTIAQLNAKITTLEAEKGQLVGQHKTAYDELNGKFGDAQKQLTTFEATQRKLTAIQAAGHPELIAIIDQLPVSETPEGQLDIVKKMASFATGLVQKREQDLLAGNTDGASGLGAIVVGQKPTTEEGWDKYVNTLPIGSKERKAAFDEYFDFVNKPTK